MKFKFNKYEVGSPKWIETVTYTNNINANTSDGNKCYRVEEAEDTIEFIEDIYSIPQEQLIDEYKSFLRSTDNYALRLSTKEATEDDYSETYNMTFKEIMQKRKETRDKLNSLENN